MKSRITLDELIANAARLEEIDADELFSASRKKSPAERKSKSEKPGWVRAWNRQNASNGPVKTVVKTTMTYREAENVVESKTELVEPVVEIRHVRNLKTGEVEDVAATVGLPEHLRLDKLHEDRESPVAWASRPEHGTVAPHGLSQREALAYEAEHPSPVPEPRDEGPTKPVRKQMLRMSKVWKYRNFKKCAVCEHFDTWESRTDPRGDGTRLTHAEIWCQTCGSVDFEVADGMPAHLGTWAPPKETEKESKLRRARQTYRRERTIFSLVESPKTAAELTKWFREVERYEGVDPIMLELMLRRMKKEGLVVFDSNTNKWWDAEDHAFEHEPKE